MMIARQALLVFVATVFPSILGPCFVDATSVSSSPDNVIGSAASLHPYKRDGDKGYTDPIAGGGYMLTIANGTYPPGLGEPLNVILSAKSDKEVIVKGLDHGGFLNYMLSAGLGEECLGQHLGSLQEANMGDGQGNVTEVEELRWNYGDPYLGTCKETFDGGLHLRYWIQNTTGAYFMAVSEEMDLSSGHDIVPNGYNHGRDHLVGNLTNTPIATRNLTNTSTYSGQTSWNNYTYQTDVHYVSGLLKNSSDGINHYITVSTDGLPAIDGLVAVLTVKIVERPQSGTIPSIHASLFAILPSLLLGAMLALA